MVSGTVLEVEEHEDANPLGPGGSHLIPPPEQLMIDRKPLGVIIAWVGVWTP